MHETLDSICFGLLDEAVHVWERSGDVVTTSFALGHSRSVFASPATEYGASIDDETRIRIHALVSSLVGATAIGRIDKSYKTELPADSPLMMKSELEELAKKDATVRTAILVQAMDIRTGDSLVCVATLQVNDDGETGWDYDSFSNPEGHMTQAFYEIAKLINAIKFPIAEHDIREQLHELEWSIADSDEILDESEYE